MNIFLSIVYLIITFSITVFIYKVFGKEGTYVWICVSIIIANIQSVKIVEIFGLTTTLGNVAYSNVFLATDILNENEGSKSANKSVIFGFIFMILFTCLMSLSLLFEASPLDTSQESLRNIFTIIPRICIASLAGYLASQFLDVLLFKKLKQKYNKLWLSNNLSTIVSQLVDTIVFTLIAYSGLVPWIELLEIAGTMYALKVIIALADTGFIYLSRHLKNKEKNNKNNDKIE